MNKVFFIQYCNVIGIDSNKAQKIINGKYKPYLSALDNKYYSGNDTWDAKINAINGYIKANNITQLIAKINAL